MAAPEEGELAAEEEEEEDEDRNSENMEVKAKGGRQAKTPRRSQQRYVFCRQYQDSQTFSSRQHLMHIIVEEADAS